MNTQISRKILIVEDEVIVSRDIRTQLNLLGYEVVGETRHGEEALTLTLQLNPDLILMDIQLAGDMNGIVAGRQIVEETGKPLVFLTAFASGELFEQAKAISPSGYILKPFEERDLRLVLDMAFYRQHVGMNCDSKVMPSPPPPTPWSLPMPKEPSNGQTDRLH